MTAHADKFDPDEADWIGRRARTRTARRSARITDTAGGTLVPLPMLGELIDLQRNLEVFATAGAQEIALPPNGRMQFPKLTGGEHRVLGRRGQRRSPRASRRPATSTSRPRSSACW